MRKYIAFGVMAVGFLFLLGTVGAAEVNAIGWTQLVWQSLGGLALVIGGTVVSYIEEKRDMKRDNPSVSPAASHLPLHKGGKEEYAAAGKVALGKGVVLFPVKEERRAE